MNGSERMVIALGAILVSIALIPLLQRIRGFAPGWQVRCLSCGWRRPGHRVGLVRLGAVSLFKTRMRYCPECRRLRFVAVERAPETARG